MNRQRIQHPWRRVASVATVLLAILAMIPATGAGAADEDFGDLPASYGTVAHSGGGPRFGTLRDAETTQQFSANADGDDDNNTDDEDGVTFDPYLCGSWIVRWSQSATANVYGFFDFNGDGDFTDAGERAIADTYIVVGGATNKSATINVPCTAPTTLSVRMRLGVGVGTTDLGPTGTAANGEVEDYRVTRPPLDHGDAPASYGDAAHVVPAGTSGAALSMRTVTQGGADVESPALFSANADGDDSTLSGGTNDERGLRPRPTTSSGQSDVNAGGPCEPLNLTVDTFNGPGFVQAWMDYNLDGDFDDAGEQLTQRAVVAGFSSVTFDDGVPCTASVGMTFLRLRISTAGGLGPTGFAADGEVEDHRFNMAGIDYGDAPASYGTLRAANGARHIATGDLTGTSNDDIDAEPDGQPGAGADGDDLGGIDDDRGDPGGATVFQCGQFSNISLGGGSNSTSAWLDINRDGDFLDSGERLFANRIGNTSFQVDLPCNLVPGTSYARVRWSNEVQVDPQPHTGLWRSGQVKDFAVTVQANALGISSFPAAGVKGQLIDFFVDLAHGGSAPVTLSIASGSGSLTCTNGLSQYIRGGSLRVNCAIHGTGSHTIRLSSPFLADAVSPVIPIAAEPAQVGYLRAYPVPALPVNIELNGVRLDTWATTWLTLPVGSYSLSFSDVPGFQTPNAQHVEIVAGQTTEVAANFAQLGVLRVDTSPPVPATISLGVDPPLDDWGVFTYFAPGTYTVCFGPVAGFQAPGCQVAVVTAGAQASIVGNYTPNASAPAPIPHATGFLRAYTNPPLSVVVTNAANQLPVPGSVIFPFGETIMNTWSTTYTRLQTQHRRVVHFTDVPGFTTPPPVVTTILSDQVTEVVGNYGVDGVMRVETNPPVPSTITINGIRRNDWGVFTWLPAGAYQVCFGAVAGFQTPACQNVNLAAGQQTNVVGNFVP